jgi:hypothetical protein
LEVKFKPSDDTVTNCYNVHALHADMLWADLFWKKWVDRKYENYERWWLAGAICIKSRIAVFDQINFYNTNAEALARTSYTIERMTALRGGDWFPFTIKTGRSYGHPEGCIIHYSNNHRNEHLILTLETQKKEEAKKQEEKQKQEDRRLRDEQAKRERNKISCSRNSSNDDSRYESDYSRAERERNAEYYAEERMYRLYPGLFEEDQGGYRRVR